jgi:transcriptional regulator with XRE-family HTH domain
MKLDALYSVRAKKIGVVLRSMRSTHGKSLEECAAAMAVSLEEYKLFERGEQSPSLPQLELMAYYLKIPLEYFWNNEIPAAESHNLEGTNRSALLNLRNRVIGALLRNRRVGQNLSVPDLADKTGLSIEQLQTYETGRSAVPFAVLEVLCEAISCPVSTFQDDRGPVGSFFVQERSTRGFKNLSPELQKFVVQPINQPYLELAKRLSEMDVDKLRSVAEGLLEITL